MVHIQWYLFLLPQQHMTLNALYSPWRGYHKHLTEEKSTFLRLQICLQGLVESSGSEWLLHQTPLQVALKGCGEEKSPQWANFGKVYVIVHFVWKMYLEPY